MADEYLLHNITQFLLFQTRWLAPALLVAPHGGDACADAPRIPRPLRPQRDLLRPHNATVRADQRRPAANLQKSELIR